MGLLSAEQEAAVNKGMNDLHYEFAKRNPFYAIKSGPITVIQEAASHNFLYPSAPNNSEVTETFQSGLFFARTYYISEAENLKSLTYQGSNQDLGTLVGDPILKIITDSTGKSLIGDAERIEWSGEYWKNLSVPARHGLLQKNFNDYYFQRMS